MHHRVEISFEVEDISPIRMAEEAHKASVNSTNHVLFLA